MERLAIDTNAFIAYRAGDTKVRFLLEGAQLLYFPMIVMGELLYGAKNSVHYQKNIHAVHDFTQICLPIFIDEAVAERYADIRMLLKDKGTPIPENDLWIAASCLEVDATLLTQDNHFSFVEGLKILKW